ncbi:MAG: dipeptidyl aminopeptidase/acylaminoacyl peptidase [Woeseiaceae bacterium]|jgi:dipeptidyl aminopeptidase/acylaminoacyl peptidase
MNNIRAFVSCMLASIFVIFILAACAPADGPASTEATETTTSADAAPAPDSDLVEVVTRMAEVGWATGATFSPDGMSVAYISSKTGAPQVWIHEGGTSEPQQVTFFEDPVSGVQWSPRGDVLAVSVAPGGGMNTQIYLAPLSKVAPQQLTAGGTVNNWLAEWSEDGRFLAFSSNVRGAGSMDCYLYDTEDKEAKLIAENDGIGTIAALSPSGERAVIWRMVSRGNSNLYLLEIASGSEQLLTPHEGVAESDIARFVDNDTILISTNIDREMIALGRIDIDAEGSAGSIRIIAERDDAELGGVQVFDGGARVALMWNASGKSELAFLSFENETMVPGPPLPAEIASGIAASADGQQLAMTVSGAATPQNVWLFHKQDNTFSQVSDSAHEGVDLETLVRPELVRYVAHDGLELSGWLYRPHNVDSPAPIVTSFHGGPEGQARPWFSSINQALLARGIGVFVPNVRGSSGFGKTFVNLDNGALRFNGIKDIESTVKYLVDAGIADPERIGIMGGSYGGYMVMAGLAEYPELFGAGANLFGVVNFETFFAKTEPWMAAISTIEYGDPVTEKDLLRDLSPIHKVDQVSAPTIVLHGANDTNVPVIEAEQVVESLKQREVPVKYVLFPDEGHGWRKTVNRVTSDVEIVTWFETYL